MSYKVKAICPVHGVEIESNLRIKSLNAIKIANGGRMIFHCPMGHDVEITNQDDLIFEEID